MVKENTVLVTIGIPTYNVGRYIELSIKSVLAQTYSNFELIITDDGSTDDTVEKIRSFKDSRIHLIVDGENRGISYRLNQQIALAKGKYFVRMDGDDLMFPNRIALQVKYLEEHPDVDVVGAGAVIIDNDNKIIGMRQSYVHCKVPEDVINHVPFIHPSVCAKLAFFMKHKYDEQLSGVEDKDLWCRGILDSTYAYYPEPLMFYRDPLKFKIGTYLSRKKKGRIQAVKRWSLFRDKKPIIRYILDSYVKSAVAYVLCKLGMESRFIANRNENGSNLSTFSELLNQVIK